MPTPGRASVQLPEGLPAERLVAVRRIAALVGVPAAAVLALGGRIVRMMSSGYYSHALLAEGYKGAPVVLHPRSGAPYALTRGCAVELNTLEPDPDDAEGIARGFRSVPLLIGGRAVVSDGLYVLSLCRLRPQHPSLPGEHLAWHQRGWLYEHELSWPPEQVAAAVIGDLAAGRWALSSERLGE